MVVVFGTDVHKKSHTFVAVDESGRRLDELTVPAPGKGHHRARLAGSLADRDGIVAELARDVLADIDRLSAMADVLEKRIGALGAEHAPELLALPGCGPLTAAKILGETAGIGQFHTQACFAMHAGSTPDPVWSGNTPGRDPALPRRQPAAALRPAPDRAHPDPAARPRPGLLPAQARRGQKHQGGPALPQKTTRQNRLPHPAKPSGRRQAAGGRLT
ncbi:transposase [Arthrobacter mobilis]|uniref:IS110 family transposase n=1 Tax=Arthrobacter mobilis TaxID=2724944 RepID=A0A7X6K7P8_9MICC|nr:transposase [Arthrobacter mobilis]NKX56682.1 IS110 family transposase [Arthrobacter mobilis]